MVGKPKVGNPRVGGFHEVQKIRILDILVFVPCKNPPGYKEYVNSFITFSFEEDVTIIEWLANMTPYISDIV